MENCLETLRGIQGRSVKFRPSSGRQPDTPDTPDGGGLEFSGARMTQARAKADKPEKLVTIPQKTMKNRVSGIHSPSFINSHFFKEKYHEYAFCY
ncbi:MAG: hypothetical protein LBU43_07700 [Candidatus Accumulibacter sp.]|jgi:hypothetical protein|nr:hypothetical protein [Accumulibacter sp.]